MQRSKNKCVSSKHPKRKRVKEGVYFVQGKADKIYYICYRHEGKLKWEKIGKASEGYNAAMAAAIRNERIRSIRHGEELPQDKAKQPTFSQLASRYFEWQKTNGRKDRNASIGLYRNHIEPVIGDKKANAVLPLDIERIKANMKEKGLSTRTIQYALFVVRAIYNRAVKLGIYQGENPAQNVRIKLADNKRMRFLSKEEAKILLDELKQTSYQLYAISAISLFTGMRASEIFSLKWSDIDFANGLIYVRNAKNGETRVVFITKEIETVLRALPQKSDLVFVSRTGGKIKEVSNTFGKVIDRLGFNDGVTDRRYKVCFHTLRHTFCSWLALNGASILQIARLAGHKTISMSERYSHLSKESQRNLVLSLSESFNEDREQKITKVKEKLFTLYP